MKNVSKIIDLKTVPYKKAWDLQKELVSKVQKRNSDDTIILLEHPHVFTIGRNGKESHLLVNEEKLKEIEAEVYKVDRGGDITYHGPGQLVGYPILNLKNYKTDIRWYISNLEETIIRALKEFDIRAVGDRKFIGVWVDDEKIASIGCRISKWVTSHGFALNVNTDLSYFKYIIPCGIKDKTITSMKELLCREINIEEVKQVIIEKFSEVFKCRMTLPNAQPEELVF